MASDREIALEQAAVALLSEAKSQGVDLSKLAESARAGILNNKIYTWVGADHKVGSSDAVDYLVGRIE